MQSKNSVLKVEMQSRFVSFRDQMKLSRSDTIVVKRFLIQAIIFYIRKLRGDLLYQLKNHLGKSNKISAKN